MEFTSTPCNVSFYYVFHFLRKKKFFLRFYFFLESKEKLKILKKNLEFVVIFSFS